MKRPRQFSLYALSVISSLALHAETLTIESDIKVQEGSGIALGDATISDAPITISRPAAETIGASHNFNWAYAQIKLSHSDDDQTLAFDPNQIVADINGPLSFWNKNAGGSFKFANGTAGGTSLFINKDGFIGIGTDTPTAALDVVGSVNISGSLTSEGESVYHSGNLNIAAVNQALELDAGSSIVTSNSDGDVAISGALVVNALQIGQVDGVVIDQAQAAKLESLSAELGLSDLSGHLADFSNTGISIFDGALGPDGSMYVYGWFYGTTNVDGTTFNSRGGADAIVVKLSKAGDVDWAIACGSGSNDYPDSITVDANGGVYLSGRFSGSVFSISGQPYLSTAGSGDIFVLRLDQVDGECLWAKSYGGTGLEENSVITVDNDGKVFVACESNSSDFVVDGLPSLATTGGDDTCVFALDSSSGDGLWAKNFGGTSYDMPEAIAADANGHLILSGYFQSTDFVYDGVNTFSNAGSNDAYLLSLNPASGDVYWGHSFGGTYSDGASDVAIADNGSVLAVGGFYGSMNVDGISLSSSGSNSWCAAFSLETGAVIWAKAYGGTSNNFAQEIAIDADGKAVISGKFNDNATFVVDTLDPLESVGDYDIYALQLNVLTGDAVWAQGFGGPQTDWLYAIETDDIGSVSLFARCENAVIGNEVSLDHAVYTFSVQHEIKFDGVIKSSSGGFVLPDGTVLASAQDLNAGGGEIDPVSTNKWLTGSTDPTTEGADGDLYLNATSGEFFQKVSGAWVSQGNLTGPQGTAGVDGADGTNGTNGVDGTDGQDGAIWLTGSGAPDDSNGTDGDLYLDSLSGDYFVKSSGMWGTAFGNLIGPQGADGQDGTPGADGQNGQDGATWLSGAVDPTSEGVDGDFYLNTSSGDYFKNASGVWSLTGNLKGPSGDSTSVASNLLTKEGGSDEVVVVNSSGGVTIAPDGIPANSVFSVSSSGVITMAKQGNISMGSFTATE